MSRPCCSGPCKRPRSLGSVLTGGTPHEPPVPARIHTPPQRPRGRSEGEGGITRNTADLIPSTFAAINLLPRLTKRHDCS